MISDKILEDLIKDSPCVKAGISSDWCFCREYLKALGYRTLLQARLVVDYQYDRDKKDNIAMTFNEAYMNFIKEGYGEKFDEIYKEIGENVTREEVFPLLFGYEIKMPTDEEIEKFNIMKTSSKSA